MNLTILKKKNFILLMQSKFVSQLGSVLQTFALSLYVLNTYDSATLFASVLMIGMIPRILLGPIAGVFVDWFDRKKIIILLDVANGAIVALVAILYFTTGTLPLWAIYSLVLGLSLINLMFAPAISTVIPTIMSDEELFDANTIDQFIMTIANILAPIIAGIFMGLTGIGIILAFNSLSFFISAVTESFIKIPKLNLQHEKLSYQVFKEDFMDGLRFFLNIKVLLKLMIMSLVLNFALSPIYSVAVPYILKKVYFVTDIHFGMFESIVVGASIIAMLVAGWASKHYTIEKIIRIDIGLQPILVGFIALISTTWFINMFTGYAIPFASMILITCIIIIIITIGNIAIHTMFQKIVPKEKLGRIGTVVGTISAGAMPLGQGLMGLAIDAMPVWIAIGISVFIMALASIYTVIYFKDGLFDDLSNKAKLTPVKNF
ncbi:MAG: MFS transporter [Vallitaleaceae bacterium]|jgi:MFS family permease|nr:MFS transporter [Vallitaleaceae bacterium]